MKNCEPYFRFFKNNLSSIAALIPLIPDAKVTHTLKDGIMIYSFATSQAKAIFKEVSNKNSILIAGGPHPSACPDNTLLYFDYVVIGEGEETLPELINVIQNKRDVSSVKGIAFKKNGKIVFTEKRPNVILDNYPPFDVNFVRSSIEITRGCPFNCTYCHTPKLFGHKMRHRSIDAIAKYSKFLSDIRFTSPNAFAYGSSGIRPEIKKIEALFKALPKENNIFFGTFPSEVRPEFINDSILELVSDYCKNTSLALGGQSGSQSELDRIKRGHSVDDIVVGVEKCLEHGFTPIVDFIFGLPNETEEEQNDTLSLIKWITSKGGKVHSHYFTPLPDTELWGFEPSCVSKKVGKVMGKLALCGKISGKWSQLEACKIGFSRDMMK